MNGATRDRSRFLMLTASGGLIIIILLLAGFMSIAGAQPEPVKPPFYGRLAEEPDGQLTTSAESVNTSDLGPEWRPVFQENFEDENCVSDWYINADLSKDPELGYMWGTRQVENSRDDSSMYSAWAVGGGTNGSNSNLIAPSYPSGVNSWLVVGPLDFSNADDVLVELDLFYEANVGDPFTIAATDTLLEDFVIQTEVNKNVNQGSWESLPVALSTYAGKPGVYIAFIFSSAAARDKIGALIDNVKIWVEGEPGIYLPYVAYGFTPTPPVVTPTATPPPGGGDFEQGFSSKIEPWAARRWTNGTAYNLSHDGSEDAGKQGFLNLLVNTSGSHYVIASPLVAGKAPPYNIETVVKLRSPREDGDQYGVVFGGNYAGGECPSTDFSTCFTQYYEMRVRFYHDDEADKDRMEMKLKRIDSHDADNNNDGPDLIEWTRVSDVEEDDFIEWDITVETDGKIKISANKNPVASAEDSTYINNPYFGVIVRTEDHADSEAKFDYFKVD